MVTGSQVEEKNKVANTPKIGQIVHLNSGSPDLTVSSFSDGKVIVTWEKDGTREQGEFPVACVH